MTGLMAHRHSRLGVALVIAGLALNPWLVGYVATDDRAIDSSAMFAALLAISAACLLGGLQLLWPWVERVSWGQPVGLLRGTTVVALTALVIAGTHWRITTYALGHTHTMLVPSADQVTPEQVQWTDDFYRRSLAAARRNGWFDIDKAMAQGFQKDPVNRTHFPNLEYMFDDVIMDPERPEWLVYADSPNGKVLMALMFFTRRLEDVGPTPGGPLAQWHYHPYDTPRCAVNGLWTIREKPDDNGVCPRGIPVMRTPEMLHVWFVDHPLGRYTQIQNIQQYWQAAEFDLRRLHPIAVHFAIALFIIAALVDIAAFVTRKRDLHRAAWVNLVLAAVAAVAAVSTGMTAETLLSPTHEAHQTLDTHKLLAYTALGGVLLLAVWRYALRGHFPQRGALLYLALTLAGVGAIGGAGYFGGEMVYTHGAAVRALDKFARDRYWRQIEEVYRYPPGGGFEDANGAAGSDRPVRTVPVDHSGHR